jgi:hypothetical protein
LARQEKGRVHERQGQEDPLGVVVSYGLFSLQRKRDKYEKEIEWGICYMGKGIFILLEIVLRVVIYKSLRNII